MNLVWTKSFFKKKRIIKTRGRYVPQIRKYFTWYGLPANDIRLREDIDTQVDYCSYGTLDDATIGMYKTLSAIKHDKQERLERKKVIVFEPEPEAWAKLKQK